MDSIASILAALDPDLNAPGINTSALARAILHSTNLSDEDKKAFGAAFGIGPREAAGGPDSPWYEKDPPGGDDGGINYRINDNSPDHIKTFLAAHPDLNADELSWNNAGIWRGTSPPFTLVATWDSLSQEWDRVL